MSERPEPFDTIALGFTLRIRKLRDCTTFYNEVLDLPIRFREDRRVCLGFGDVYLMLISDDDPPPVADNPTLRIFVRDVVVAAGQLSMRGVAVDLGRSGDIAIASFRDPDGNLCTLQTAEAGFLESDGNG